VAAARTTRSSRPGATRARGHVPARGAASAAALDAHARAIRRTLESLADPAHATVMATIAPSAVPHLGIRVPAVRAAVREFARSHRDWTAADAAGLLDRLAGTQRREEILFGTFLLARFRRRFDPSLWKHLPRWLAAVDNWETCDQLAGGVVAPLVAAEPSRVAELLRWTAHRSPWVRRCAAATAANLNHAGRGMVAETIAVCDRLMTETDPNVIKAVGWALRDATKSDLHAVAAFLVSWRGRATPRILREGSEKLRA
jgi:3-methyladenine DNA glycosylase AlkD